MNKENRFVIQVDPLEIEDDAIFDNKELKLYECQSDMMSDICSLLNKQENRIAELEEQLKNKPKFNVGDKVYLINKDEEVERDFIESIDIDTFGIEYYTVMHSICWYENELFSTKDEAQAKLKELGEKR